MTCWIDHNWHVNQHTYPVLVAMVHDVLSPMGSAVPLESGFNASTRVLDPKTRRLLEKALEMFVCFRDWRDVEFEEQGIKLVDESSEDELDE